MSKNHGLESFGHYSSVFLKAGTLINCTGIPWRLYRFYPTRKLKIILEMSPDFSRYLRIQRLMTSYTLQVSLLSHLVYPTSQALRNTVYSPVIKLWINPVDYFQIEIIPYNSNIHYLNRAPPWRCFLLLFLIITRKHIDLADHIFKHSGLKSAVLWGKWAVPKFYCYLKPSQLKQFQKYFNIAYFNRKQCLLSCGVRVKCGCFYLTGIKSSWPDVAFNQCSLNTVCLTLPTLKCYNRQNTY